MTDTETGNVSLVTKILLSMMSKFMSADACWWFENENGWWETGCSNLFQFVSGTPSENHFGYCPYCGKKITEDRS
jgi:hypothetical protein